MAVIFFFKHTQVCFGSAFPPPIYTLTYNYTYIYTYIYIYTNIYIYIYLYIYIPTFSNLLMLAFFTYFSCSFLAKFQAKQPDLMDRDGWLSQLNLPPIFHLYWLDNVRQRFWANIPQLLPTYSYHPSWIYGYYTW